MNNVVYYIKQKKLSLPVTRLKLEKIPILESVQLNFYQKYIILLLQNGYKAEDCQDLIEKISETLNISTICVEDFVNYLIKENNIIFNREKNMYSLVDDIFYYIDKENNNIMFAGLDTSFADCNNILFLDNFNEICLETDFLDKDLYEFKTSNRSNTTIENIRSVLSKNEDKIRNGVTESFRNSNYHLKKDFSYELTDELYPYMIEFNVSVTYQYSKETKEAKKVDISVPKNNNIPKHIVEQLSKTLNNDSELPRFISLEESFYDKSNSELINIDKNETDLSNLEIELYNLNQLVQKQKDELSKQKEEHKKELQKLVNERDSLKNEIQSKNEFIKNNKENLIKDLEKKEKEIIKLSNDYNKLEKEQNEVIQSKEIVIDEKNKELNRLIVENKKANELLNKLLVDHRNNLDPKTIQIIDKYSNEKSLFCRSVTSICIDLDKAISASDSESFDETIIAIDRVRTTYKKIVKVVLDSMFNRNAPKLADYYSTAQKCAELEKLFINHKSSADMVNRLKKFHRLLDAITHFLDNDNKTNDNINIIESFKSSTVYEKRQILFTSHDFFLTFDFTAQEKKSFSSKLRI